MVVKDGRDVGGRPPGTQNKPKTTAELLRRVEAAAKADGKVFNYSIDDPAPARDKRRRRMIRIAPLELESFLKARRSAAAPPSPRRRPPKYKRYV